MQVAWSGNAKPVGSTGGCSALPGGGSAGVPGPHELNRQYAQPQEQDGQEKPLVQTGSNSRSRRLNQRYEQDHRHCRCNQ